jgi:hypothetical protein
MVPLVWIVLTAFKTPPDSIAYPPKLLFQPSLEGYVNLFTICTRQTPKYMGSRPPPQTWYDRLVRCRDMVIERLCKYVPCLANSLVIGFNSTFLSVFLGTLAAYDFSRFRVPLKDDLLSFILSTPLYPHMNIRENVGFPLRCIGSARAESDAASKGAARLLRIDHLLESPVGRLAGGDRQRLALGRAIIVRRLGFPHGRAARHIGCRLRDAPARHPA